MYEDEHPRVAEKLCHIIIWTHMQHLHTPSQSLSMVISSAYRQPAVRVNHAGTTMSRQTALAAQNSPQNANSLSSSEAENANVILSSYSTLTGLRGGGLVTCSCAVLTSS